MFHLVCAIPEAAEAVIRLLFRTLGSAATEIVKSSVIRPLERVEDKRQAKTDVDLRIIAAIGEKELDAVKRIDNETIADIIEESGSSRNRWKQRNLSKTVLLALRKLPRNSMKNQPKPVSIEFMDVYIPVVENQSTEHMQELFARILSGEIQNPGSFSKRTLRVAEQLDQETAKSFQRLCSMALVQDTGVLVDSKCRALRTFGRRPDDVSRIVSSFDGSPGKNVLEEFELSFSALSKLVEYGLVVPSIGIRADFTQSVIYDIDYTYPTPRFPFRYRGESWLLRREIANRTFNSKHFKDFEMNGVGFSAVGHELFSIVEKIENPEYTVKLREYFSSQNFTMIEYVIPEGVSPRGDISITTRLL